MLNTMAISQGEKKKVSDLLNSGTISSPIGVVAKLLNEHFGWSLATGKVRAKAIIDQLLKEKVVEADRDSRGLRSISLARTQISKDHLNPRLIKPHEDTAPTLKPEVQVVITRRRPYKPKKKGVARARRQSELVGEKAERRLHEVSLKLAGVLKSKYPKLIMEISVSRSGHNNIKKGTVDLQDSAGEDITILMTLCEGGRYRKERIIYDAKNSRISASNFNRNIRLYPQQTGAILKKAISTNKMRSDHEIAEEILLDMVSVQLIPAQAREDSLSEFDEVA